LIDNGLNLHAVFDIESLPEGLLARLCSQHRDLNHYRQLHLFGHAGRRMWEAMQHSDQADTADPVDSFSANLVDRYFSATPGCSDYRMLFPGGERVVPLQQLGELAGWHHPSPFRIGVNRKWGSWFAYRAVVLSNTDLAPTAKMASGSPCEACAARPCLAACPASAVTSSKLLLESCIDYRLQDDSQCRAQCLSRLACPIAVEHRYSEEQINYHYMRSLQTIRQYRQEGKMNGPSVPPAGPGPES